MNDGFDIGVNRQSQDNGIDDQIDPGNCDALGQSTTYEKVICWIINFFEKKNLPYWFLG